MINRTYKCDLCRDRHEPEDLVGIEWSAGHVISIKHARQTEHHLCQRCIDNIKRFPEKTAE